MPELPEVETVRQGLLPVLAGARLEAVEISRPDLRFPFPDRFAARLQGHSVETVHRRGKYLIAPLSSGESLIAHLGMSGRFMIIDQGTPGRYVHQVVGEKHIHVRMHTKGGVAGEGHIHYADPRRFGFMDLVPSTEIEACRHFAAMGPEPLSDAFSPAFLKGRLAGKASSIKAALLDQAVVAGLGNIYVCEALFRAGISPKRKAQSLGRVRVERLVPVIKTVLEEAIVAGGSSLRDYAAADGTMGEFQHHFHVYGREGEPCDQCSTPIRRFVQSGRSSFACGQCQR